MTVVGVVVLMTVLLVIGLKYRVVRFGALAVGVLYGFLLAATPAQEPVGDAVNNLGGYAWGELQRIGR
ncbi:MAG: hypothetical protein GEU93_04165 [Propionibacteriales bacterium]|nr:hypothetical protein [Propionibacteriales bacterium]